MARFRRGRKEPNVNDTATNSNIMVSAIPDVPRVNLPHVETHLNMHQHNGFFEASTPEHQNGSAMEPSPVIDDPSLSPSAAANTHNDIIASPEWSSAVGHAATGKSGRVIHNLQEDIARLTRECSLQRSRAEEAQRNNEALKTQLQNMTERVRNLELSHEANLHSISRKDRKIEELRGEIQTERERRESAEGETRKIHQIMTDSRDNFNRKCAELQEIANYSQTQYDVLAKTGKRDKADMQKKLNTMREDFASLQRQNNEKDIQLQRLDVIMAQKNREIETATERTERLLESYDTYRKGNDQELRQMIERGHEKDKIIDEALASLKETEAKMKWTIQVKNEVKGAE
ncbi:hypothetical protein NFIA_098140 [Paecilomyces variotii No. 5]|uniref:SWI5-dependent HO expression protein 3 n=1 Tax=Byssochlamys spectabilis (strain No. 5 / NBRC 109023) TaxID=1356009 RepID=V5FQF5_BYSSN|nr:hypothetical protein NFIA_098140 [Paecilomyces variotii No. 5]